MYIYFVKHIKISKKKDRKLQQIIFNISIISI